MMAAHTFGAVSRLAQAVIVLVFSGVMQQSFGADRVIQCPLEIEGASVQIVPAPNGWTAFSPHTLTLNAAGFMDGPPADMADLKPYSIKKNKAGSTETWRFDDGPLIKGRWVSCDYGRDGDVTLSREVPDDTLECTVDYKKNPERLGFWNIAIKCKGDRPKGNTTAGPASTHTPSKR